MEKINLTLEGGQICCHRFGHGPAMILALHGFGADGRVFAPLEPALAPHCTIYAPDLPFHGESQWRRPVFSPSDLLELRRESLRAAGRDRCHSLGYSMGGRLLLSTLGNWSDPGGYLFLLAPDGLGTKGMTLTDGFPVAWRRKVARELQSPARLLRLTRFLFRTGWLDRFTFFYLKHHLGQAGRRDRLLRTWISLASFPIHKKKLQKDFDRWGPSVEVIIGREDPLIDHQKVVRFFQRCPPVRIHSLAADHILLAGTSKDEIADIIRGRLQSSEPTGGSLHP